MHVPSAVSQLELQQSVSWLHPSPFGAQVFEHMLEFMSQGLPLQQSLSTLHEPPTIMQEPPLDELLPVEPPAPTMPPQYPLMQSPLQQSSSVRH